MTVDEEVAMLRKQLAELQTITEAAMWATYRGFLRGDFQRWRDRWGR